MILPTVYVIRCVFEHPTSNVKLPTSKFTWKLDIPCWLLDIQINTETSPYPLPLPQTPIRIPVTDPDIVHYDCGAVFTVGAAVEDADTDLVESFVGP